MTKRFFLIFLAAALVTAALLAGFNAAVDPFGIFGDRFLSFWSYDMTQNPRTAKIGYLDTHHQDYDAYIIGCSKTSSFPTDRLNALYDAHFYNMIMYGGDLYDCEKTAEYVLEHYGARQIVINIGFDELMEYDNESDSMKGNLHCKVDGSNPLLFYGKYLFSNPKYGLKKLKAYTQNGFLVNADRVFVPETGVYDKSLRDVENIASLDTYLAKYPEFTQTHTAVAALPDTQKALDSIARIKALCERHGAGFTFLISPMYANDLDRYICPDLLDFLKRLADITDYWDFNGYTEAAFEPRWFYDATHPRNMLGDMALAVMAGKTDRYLPQNFGVHVTPENAADLSRYTRPEAPAADHDVQVPVLMYHHISDTFQSSATVTVATFRTQMEALRAAGYHTVTARQLMDYVDYGTPLPENPLYITFDDGYASNLEIAAPILEELGFSAEIAVIGENIGGGVADLPHFALEDAVPWMEKGVLELGSHSFNLHHTEPRLGVYRMKEEREADYVELFAEDSRWITHEILKCTGTAPVVYAYPYGYWTEVTEVILAGYDYRITLTVTDGMNTVVKGLPQSLRTLKRHNVTESMTPQQLIEDLKGLN